MHTASWTVAGGVKVRCSSQISDMMEDGENMNSVPDWGWRWKTVPDLSVTSVRWWWQSWGGGATWRPINLCGGPGNDRTNSSVSWSSSSSSSSSSRPTTALLTCLESWGYFISMTGRDLLDSWQAPSLIWRLANPVTSFFIFSFILIIKVLICTFIIKVNSVSGEI